eukprot:TRINITY_DN48229_c0_g1_i1.p1 TRINITY_DN48229_c0_g1~~TRINITY_DN48229_c0_g1_i1.p1  ORF type:complete len:1039 (-),score=206.50 TRINITY_DN48229_c0_g1_i1:458-3574(-)
MLDVPANTDVGPRLNVAGQRPSRSRERSSDSHRHHKARSHTRDDHEHHAGHRSKSHADDADAGRGGDEDKEKKHKKKKKKDKELKDDKPKVVAVAIDGGFAGGHIATPPSDPFGGPVDAADDELALGAVVNDPISAKFDDGSDDGSDGKVPVEPSLHNSSDGQVDDKESLGGSRTGADTTYEPVAPSGGRDWSGEADHAKVADSSVADDPADARNGNVLGAVGVVFNKTADVVVSHQDDQSGVADQATVTASDPVVAPTKLVDSVPGREDGIGIDSGNIGGEFVHPNTIVDPSGKGEPSTDSTITTVIDLSTKPSANGGDVKPGSAGGDASTATEPSGEYAGRSDAAGFAKDFDSATAKSEGPTVKSFATASRAESDVAAFADTRSAGLVVATSIPAKKTIDDPGALGSKTSNAPTANRDGLVTANVVVSSVEGRGAGSDHIKPRVQDFMSSGDSSEVKNTKRSDDGNVIPTVIVNGASVALAPSRRAGAVDNGRTASEVASVATGTRDVFDGIPTGRNKHVAEESLPAQQKVDTQKTVLSPTKGHAAEAQLTPIPVQKVQMRADGSASTVAHGGQGIQSVKEFGATSDSEDDEDTTYVYLLAASSPVPVAESTVPTAAASFLDAGPAQTKSSTDGPVSLRNAKRHKPGVYMVNRLVTDCHNLRSAPHFSAPKIGELRAGDVVDVVMVLEEQAAGGHGSGLEHWGQLARLETGHPGKPQNAASWTLLENAVGRCFLQFIAALPANDSPKVPFASVQPDPLDRFAARLLCVGLRLVFLTPSGEAVTVFFSSRPLGFDMKDDGKKLEVSSVTEGSQAEANGVKLGWVLTNVVDVNVDSMSAAEALRVYNEHAVLLPEDSAPKGVQVDGQWEIEGIDIDARADLRLLLLDKSDAPRVAQVKWEQERGLDPLGAEDASLRVFAERLAAFDKTAGVEKERCDKMNKQIEELQTDVAKRKSDKRARAFMSDGRSSDSTALAREAWEAAKLDINMDTRGILERLQDARKLAASDAISELATLRAARGAGVEDLSFEAQTSPLLNR